MLKGRDRRWRGSLLLGLSLPLLLGSAPAAAAGATDLGAGGLTTWIGIAAALWAVLAAAAAPTGANGVVAAAFVLIVLAGALYVWRRRRGRHGRARVGAPTRLLAPAASALRVPVGLDGAAVLDAARGRFMHLQAAWDAGDVSALKSLTTPEMLEELLHVLTARGDAGSRTDVITLHAELLGLEELSAAYLASVEFSGLIREWAEQGAVPFRELWMLACMKDEASSWRLARQQSLF